MVRTFVFCDLAASPDLSDVGEAIAAALKEHGGEDVRTEGNNVLGAFGNNRAAILAAIAGSRVAAASRPRIAVHTGLADQTQAGFVGLGLNEAARVCVVAHPGQVLATETAAGSPADVLDEIGFVSVGRHRLKDVPKSMELFQILAPDLTSAFPATGGDLGTLPYFSPPFIGRRQELEDVLDLLEANSRLVSITGAPGTGKTRLAVEVARAIANRFPDGVWFVPAPAASEPAALLPALQRTIGFGTSDEFAAYLADRKALVILDGVFNLTEAAPAVMDAVATPIISRVLVTSCEIVNSHSGTGINLTPLGFTAESDQATRFMRELRGPEKDEEISTERVRHLCAQLDGLPLALECAAGREVSLERSLLELLESPDRLPQWLDPLAKSLASVFSHVADDELDLLAKICDGPTTFSLQDLSQQSELNVATKLQLVQLLDSLVGKNLVYPTAEPGGLGIFETFRRYVRQVALGT